ncbi:Pr6Pr family membrane protein [Microbacterium sp. LMI1x-1-1.1]|uniref:Pr6Pr family membrane protein n=1 Tax=Microbacterium sp. LMI1x-1-1.1 TaxID=3135246 RepID=UPI00342266F2
MRTRTWPTVWSALRLVAAATITVAVVAQFITTVRTAISQDRDVATTIANFFSFFTILSNIVGALALLAAVVWFWMRPHHEQREPAGVALGLAAATSYLFITGVVYNLLLRGYPTSDDHVAWANEIVHVVAPLFLLLDLFLAPTRRALPWRAVIAILAVPIAWIGYTLVRGPLVIDPTDGVAFWYPYPFLDPNGINGWGGVGAYVVGISTAFVVVGSLVVGVGRLRTRAPRVPAPA